MTNVHRTAYAIKIFCLKTTTASADAAFSETMYIFYTLTTRQCNEEPSPLKITLKLFLNGIDLLHNIFNGDLK